MYCRFGAVCSQQLVALGGRLRSEKSHFSHSDDRMGVVGQQDGDDPVARVAPLPAAATHINDCENRVSGLLIKDIGCDMRIGMHLLRFLFEEMSHR